MTTHQHIASDEAALLAATQPFGGGCVASLTLDNESAVDETYRKRTREIDEQIRQNSQNITYTPSAAWRTAMRQ
jgi:hypothetical protein